ITEEDILMNSSHSSLRQFLVILNCAVILTLFAMFFQLRTFGDVYRDKTFEESYYYFLEKGYQYEGHMNVINGTAGSPWRYRLFAEVVVELLINLFDRLNVPHPIANGFIIIRFLQGILVITLAGLYYRLLSLNFYLVLSGLLMLAWSISYSLYNSDLSPNTFFDLAFYLLAVVLVFKRAEILVIPLMVFAALNRETSVLIPVIVVSACYWRDAREIPKFRFSTDLFSWTKIELMRCHRLLIVAGLSFVVYWTVFILLRITIPPGPFATPYNISPGLPLLIFNLTSYNTWMFIIATLSIIPLLAIFLYTFWPPSIKMFFWIIVPVWFGVHLLFGIFAETRLFLVPQAVVFIPGFLAGLQNHLAVIIKAES
ncbi:MAG TPA: hypothetical protein PLK31_23230, partial [Chloroflexota bacterium]|nr:hypothetical protein [Chloroflexota bacterium]